MVSHVCTTYDKWRGRYAPSPVWFADAITVLDQLDVREAWGPAGDLTHEVRTSAETFNLLGSLREIRWNYFTVNGVCFCGSISLIMWLYMRVVAGARQIRRFPG